MNTVSVVVPTFNERDNVRELLTRLEESLGEQDFEVIFVDDSTDDTPDVIRQAAAFHSMPVRCLHRDSPVGGLGGAVVEGFRAAQGDWIVVMDGDLQHDPDTIPRLMRAGAQADVVVASRYIEGGSAGGLDGGMRHLVSSGSTLLSKTLFPKRLAACSDPMSGFFAVRRSALNIAALRPNGFKILLEMLTRQTLRIAEVAFTFKERHAGESTASMKEGLRFLRQLIKLRLANRQLAFLAVGASGVLPNLVAIAALTGLGMHYLQAAIIGTQLGIGWNFAGAELFVWKDRRHGKSFLSRAFHFGLLGETDLLRLPVLWFLVERAHLGSIVATIVTFALFFALRFTVADRIIYRLKHSAVIVDVPSQRPALAFEKEEVPI